MSLYDDLIAAGLPVSSAEVNQGVTGLPGVVWTQQQLDTLQEIVLRYSDINKYNDLIAHKALVQQIKDEYQNMITRLEQIQSAINPTNTQIIQAIKDEALYIERVMKFMKNILV